MKKEEFSDCEEESDNDTQKIKRKQVECIMGDYSAEQLRNMHPQRTTWPFKMAKN
jgi:hypothetical protein